MSNAAPDNFAHAPPTDLWHEERREYPFVLRLHRQHEQTGGRFVPAAAVEITPLLRTSGLLQELPAEELKTLLLLFTFVTPNGDILPTLSQLAQVLRLSSATTTARLKRLAALRWQGQPLVQELRRDSGLHAWTPSPRLLATFAEEPAPATPATPPLLSAGREAVIAHSRATYARPRALVEEEIARRNGWPYPFRSRAEATQDVSQNAAEQGNVLPAARNTSLPHSPFVTGSGDVADLQQRLLALGLKSEQVGMLLARFDPERIRRQIRWLPTRNARNPAAFLLSAIENDYAAPAGSVMPSSADRSG